MGFWEDAARNVGNGVVGAVTGNYNTFKAPSSRNRAGGGTFGTPVKKKAAPAPAAGNPWDDLYSWADQFGTESGGSGGGSGGGGGGGSAYDAIMAAINRQKDNATGRYNDQKGQINQIYTQYADSLKPNEAATKASYNTAINAANTAGSAIAGQATARAAANDAQRDAGLGALGITGPATSGSGDESKAVNQGLTGLAADNASWGNMENVLSAAQQSRDRLDVQGATDAGVLATKNLTDSYEQYMRTLDQQAAGAVASGGGGGSSGGGGGGKGSTYKNPMLDMINKAVGNDMIAQALGTGRYDPSKQKATYSDKQIATAYSKVNAFLKKNPKATETQIKSSVGPANWKAYNS